jgi:hypothetical protein
MRPAFFPRSGWLVSSLLALFVSTAWGQLPQPVLSTVFPPGGKAGTELEVTVGGTDLDEAEQLLFTHPGIKAQLKMSPPADPSKKPKRVEGQFQVKIEGNVPPGVYEARLVGRFGVSNPRAFVVSTANEVVDAGGNNSADKATDLALGAVVNGKVDANQFKFYKVVLKTNERIVVTCQGQRLDSRLVPTVSLLSPVGKELVRARSAEGDDALLEFTAPSEGTYLVRLHDVVYGGGAEHFFRLSAQSSPRIEFIFPPAGVPGSNGSYTIFGRNLPNGQPAGEASPGQAPLQKVQVNIAVPADADRQFAFDTRPALQRAWLAAIEYKLDSPAGPSNSLPLYVAKAPVVVEQEPNGSDKPQQVNIPCEIAGQFYPHSDDDWYQFAAKKGDVLSLDVISHRLGLSTDPYLALFKVTKDEKGVEKLTDVAQVDDPGDRNNKMGTDFDTSTDDPYFKLTVAEDAVYRVMIRDQFGTGRSEMQMVYRLSIRPPQPDFAIVAQPKSVAAGQPNNQKSDVLSPVIRKGGTALIDVDLLRSDEFAGEVTVSVEGLPPGMTCPAAIAGPTINSVPLILTAADSMAAWTGPVKIVGKATVDGKEVAREARYAVMVWGSANRQQQLPTFRLSQAMQVAVIDKEMEAFFVQVEDKIWETSVGGNVEVPVKITRHGDFKDAVKLTAAGLPQEIKPKEINADANTGEAKLEVPFTAANVKPGVYTFYLKGEAKRKYIRNPDAVAAVEAEVKETTEEIARPTKPKHSWTRSSIR